MLRRGRLLLATNIPRSVWDPAQHNTNWSDSYSADIAARRHWPAKQWSIGLEPRTPREWLRFSYRNLAYAYNGALRACSSFPEMLLYYREMKQRGVKVDVDTLNVLLTRAARYEHIRTDDIFLLFDELTRLGARPDLSSVETLHTVLEHSASQPFEWREARRRQLVELYNHLAAEEVDRLGPQHVDALLAAQLARIRGNLRQLRASLSPSVYRRYFAVLDSGELLLREVHNFLWEFVAADHPALEIPSLQLRIPFVASVMKRPALEGNGADNTDKAAAAAVAALSAKDFEDSDVCAVIQAAVERCIDGPFHDTRVVTERRLYLSLLTMLTSSGVLYTADLVAQLMDIVKYSRLDDRRDDDAIRLLRYAMRGSSAASDEAYRRLWQAVEEVVDARVVGRYLASRSPWTAVRICPDDRNAFGSYPTAQLAAGGRNNSSSGGRGGGSSSADAAGDASGEAEAAAAAASAEEETGASAGKQGGNNSSSSSSHRGAATELRTVEGLKLRWNDVKALVAKTKALSLDRLAAKAAAAPVSSSLGAAAAPAGSTGHSEEIAARMQAKMEVFTGMAVFLRGAATGQRYGSLEAALATHAAGGEGGSSNSNSGGGSGGSGASGASAAGPLIADGLSLEVWDFIFRCVQETHQEMEAFMAQAPTSTVASALGGAEVTVEPEFECWESLMITLRCVLDYCVLHRQQKGGAAADAQALFQQAAKLRAQLVEESSTRFNGRMRILWLQEA